MNTQTTVLNCFSCGCEIAPSIAFKYFHADDNKFICPECKHYAKPKNDGYISAVLNEVSTGRFMEFSKNANMGKIPISKNLTIVFKVGA